MVVSNQLRKISRIVYQLKRLWGTKILWRKYQDPAGTDYDYTLGTIQQSFDEYIIKKAIVLPVRRDTKFEYDLAFIASNRNFTYGGYYDRNRRNFIIDAKDLPRINKVLVEPVQSDIIIKDDQLYEIEESTPTEEKLAYLITARHVNNTDPEDQD